MLIWNICFTDEIKWQIRMPERFAMREQSLMYNDKIQDEILNFLGQKIKADYLQGNRDINLDLSVTEAERLYNANDRVRGMAESGELQGLHQRCVDQQEAVQTGFIKVMDLLDRTLL